MTHSIPAAPPRVFPLSTSLPSPHDPPRARGWAHATPMARGSRASHPPGLPKNPACPPRAPCWGRRGAGMQGSARPGAEEKPQARSMKLPPCWGGALLQDIQQHPHLAPTAWHPCSILGGVGHPGLSPTPGRGTQGSPQSLVAPRRRITHISAALMHQAHLPARASCPGAMQGAPPMLQPHGHLAQVWGPSMMMPSCPPWDPARGHPCPTSQP